MPLSPASPGASFPFEHDFIPNFSYQDVYSTEAPQLSSTTIMPQAPNPDDNSLLSPVPWDSQNAQISDFQFNANSGIVTFEPKKGNAYGTHLARQQYLEVAQQSGIHFGPEPMTSPFDQSDTEGWVGTSSLAPSSYAPSHGSPQSHGSPASHPPSPSQHDPDHHSHIFNALPGLPKAKLTRGRQRGLTPLEKKQARDVRDAKACWACHISKTKVRVSFPPSCIYNSHSIFSVRHAHPVNHASNATDLRGREDSASFLALTIPWKLYLRLWCLVRQRVWIS
jgi:hypothetical protein